MLIYKLLSSIYKRANTLKFVVEDCNLKQKSGLTIFLFPTRT